MGVNSHFAGQGWGGWGGDGATGESGLGAGIRTSNSDCIVKNNLFFNNQTGNANGGNGADGGKGWNSFWGESNFQGAGGDGGDGKSGNGSSICLNGSIVTTENGTMTGNGCGECQGGEPGEGYYVSYPGLSIPGTGVIYNGVGNSFALSNSILWDNETPNIVGGAEVTWSCVEGGYFGTGNLDLDPLFVSGPLGDYFLSQIESGQPVQSPCVNSGRPTSSLFPGTTRTDSVQDYAIIDMGFHYPCFVNQSELLLSTSYLVFVGAAGGLDPADQTFRIINSSVGYFDYEVYEDCEWLDAFPESGGPVPPIDTITVSIDNSGLPIGTYQCDIVVTAKGAQNSPDTVSVDLLLGEAFLSLSPDSLDFEAAIGGVNPPTQLFTINNPGVGAYNFAISENVSWLRATPDSGGPAPPEAVAAIAVDITGLNLGSYEASVLVTANGAVNSPDSVSVTLIIGEAFLSIEPDSLVFVTALGAHNPSPQTLIINNSGLGYFYFSIDESVPWLTVEPPRGGPIPPEGSVEVSVDATGLAVGNYGGAIRVEGDCAINSPVLVYVSLVVHAPILCVEPDTLVFVGEVGGSNPPDQTFTISNQGAGSFQYYIIDPIAWVTVTLLQGGTVPPPARKNVSVEISNLGAGTHSGDIEVVALDAAGSPAPVHVILQLEELGVSQQSMVKRIPDTYFLESGHPNPFNPATTITFGLPVPSQVKLVVYDLQGRMVAELVNGIRQAGVHQVTWEAGNLPSGLYFCKIQAGDFTEVRKMVLVK